MQHTHPSIDAPSAALGGPGAAAAARRTFLATRPPFLIASVLPVLIGTAWASAAFHEFNGLLFGLALAATILAHAATNVYNDVSDDVIGADLANTSRIYPYTGGSRFIQCGLLSRRDMTRIACGLAAAAVLFGAALTLLRGPGVLAFGIVGLALGLLYSLPGVQLSARGTGEAAVALGLGVLPVLGASWLQTGMVDSGAALISVPVSCWVAAILVINEVPDAAADGLAGKRTLVVRWGVSGARALYRGLTVIALAASVFAMLRHALPAVYAVPALALAGLGLWTAQGISMNPSRRQALKRRIELTLAIQAVGCISLLVAILMEHRV